MKLIINARISGDLEKAIYENAKEGIINKINKYLTKEELDKVTINFIGSNNRNLSYKIDGDKDIAEKIKQILKNK